MLSKFAKADLRDIWLFGFERWSAVQADRYLKRLENTFTFLCDYPEIARMHKAITPAVQIYPVLSHVLIFVTNDEVLDVLRVVHARSDWEGMLGNSAAHIFEE
jgi:toxin ParE1/3/4